MPEMDGFAATEFIRSKMPKQKKDIPILALTASVLRTDLEKCIAAGMNGYIAKPFNSKELFSKMAGIIKRKNSNQNIDPVEKDRTLSEEEHIDLSYLDNFTDGDRGEMSHYLNEFLETIPQKLLHIRNCIHHKNFPELQNQIHAIKPMLIAMGIHSVNQFDENVIEPLGQKNYLEKAQQLCIVTGHALDEITFIYKNEYAS